jgi:hypothetical protein
LLLLTFICVYSLYISISLFSVEVALAGVILSIKHSSTNSAMPSDLALQRRSASKRTKGVNRLSVSIDLLACRIMAWSPIHGP